MWIASLANGLWLRGGTGSYEFNPATEIGVEFPGDAQPDPIRTRYDATAPRKTRPATAQEIADALALDKDRRTNTRSDAPETMALLEFVLRRTLGRNPNPSERAAAVSELRGILRNLINGS